MVPSRTLVLSDLMCDGTRLLKETQLCIEQFRKEIF